MSRERMPNFIARKSKWTIMFRRGWFVFWPMLLALVALILLHLNTFAHSLPFLDGGHTLYKVSKQDSTCTEEGNIAYWICWKCDKRYKNYDSKTGIASEEITADDTVIPTKKHDLVHYDELASSAMYDGHVEHWSCKDCNKTFADKDAKNELQNVVIPAKPDADHTHELSKVETTLDNACKNPVDVTYYSCSGCKMLFEDKEGNTEFDLAKATNHKIEYVAAKESTCTERGNIAHYKCTDSKCNKLYSDPELQNEVSAEDVDLGYGHNIDHAVAIDKTRTLKGNTELYFCFKCERMHKIYLDAAGEIEVLRPGTITVFGVRLHSMTPVLAIYTFIAIVILISALVRVKCHYIEFYDDYVIQKHGVFWRRSRKSIFPQITRVSAQKHFFNYGNIIIDVVGPWDVIDMEGLARPEDIRTYLLDHMVNPSAVESIGNNPYIAALGITNDTIF